MDRLRLCTKRFMYFSFWLGWRMILHPIKLRWISFVVVVVVVTSDNVHPCRMLVLIVYFILFYLLHYLLSLSEYCYRCDWIIFSPTHRIHLQSICIYTVYIFICVLETKNSSMNFFQEQHNIELFLFNVWIFLAKYLSCIWVTKRHWLAHANVFSMYCFFSLLIWFFCSVCFI